MLNKIITISYAFYVHMRWSRNNILCMYSREVGRERVATHIFDIFMKDILNFEKEEAAARSLSTACRAAMWNNIFENDVFENTYVYVCDIGPRLFLHPFRRYFHYFRWQYRNTRELAQRRALGVRASEVSLSIFRNPTGGEKEWCGRWWTRGKMLSESVGVLHGDSSRFANTLTIPFRQRRRATANRYG